MKAFKTTLRSNIYKKLLRLRFFLLPFTILPFCDILCLILPRKEPLCPPLPYLLPRWLTLVTQSVNCASVSCWSGLVSLLPRGSIDLPLTLSGAGGTSRSGSPHSSQPDRGGNRNFPPRAESHPSQCAQKCNNAGIPSCHRL